jgi:hypothetical protein
MKRFCMAAIVAAALFASPVGLRAASDDGIKAELLRTACSPPNGAEQAARDLFAKLCQTYLQGLTDGLFLMRGFIENGNAGCLPADRPISLAEAQADFEVFLRDHPELAQNSAGLVAAAGIMRAYPCPARN